MGRYTDNAPVGNTCPMIDDVISFISGIQWDLTNEDETELNQKSKEALETLEKIRDANQKLRDWGNEEYKDKEYFEKERYELLKQVEYLKSDLEDMTNDRDMHVEAARDMLSELQSRQ